MRILSFGHIPSWAGGHQESGLANVIYQLAKHGSDIDDADVTLVATDSFVPLRKDGKLTILGWTKKMLFWYILVHPGKAVKSFFKLKKLKKEYPIRESFVGIYLKRVFFEKSVKCVKPHVVHLHGVQSIWYLDLIPANTKIAVTFHGMTGLDVNVPESKVLFNIERAIFQSSRVNEVFFICTQLVGQFKETYGGNGKSNPVILNSYDKSHFYYMEDTQKSSRSDREAAGQSVKISLCTVASLSDLKGQKRVLSGLSLLPDRNRFRYFCIGGGDKEYVEKLNKIAFDNGIEFEYLGKMPPDDIRYNLSKADYMIMPSSSEGFGLTYLESIACGVPVILPKNIPIAAEKELINEKNSIMLEDCLSESIASVLSHIDNYNFDPREVANSIVGSSWDETARQYIEAYTKL